MLPHPIHLSPELPLRFAVESAVALANADEEVEKIHVERRRDFLKGC
jgi:hypothetical protein